MGTNRRYADSIDRRMLKRIRESELRPQYESLPPELTNVEKDKPVAPLEPVPVEAWIRMTPGVVRIEAVAVEWNKKAARIEWKAPDGSSKTAWVYLGAISRRD